MIATPAPPSSANVFDLALPHPIAHQQKANRQPGKRKSCPGEDREEPRLRLLKRVYAVDIRLERPGQPAQPQSRPHQRRGQRDCKRDAHGRNRRTHSPTASQPAHHAHQHHGEADGVQDVHPQQVRPRRPRESKQVLLQPEEQAQPEDFSAAKDSGARYLIGISAALAQFVRNQGERYPGKKKKQRRRQCAAQLRPHEEGALARGAAQPGVVAVGLEHEYAGQAAHPVDVSQARG